MNDILPFSIDQSHKPLEQPFINWCSYNGIDTSTADDCKAWWDCYLAGATCMYLLIKNKTIDI